ncbi:hypothetical protein K440DRAFT_641531 [Wilcoxina mikolae CBS 423.85]|nr:hypothetical protein K440DRAFT_641531 [Wilcoxina mikolae CBS 423.85]
MTSANSPTVVWQVGQADNKGKQEVAALNDDNLNKLLLRTYALRTPQRRRPPDLGRPEPRGYHDIHVGSHDPHVSRGSGDSCSPLDDSDIFHGYHGYHGYQGYLDDSDNSHGCDGPRNDSNDYDCSDSHLAVHAVSSIRTKSSPRCHAETSPRSPSTKSLLLRTVKNPSSRTDPSQRYHVETSLYNRTVRSPNRRSQEPV